MPVIEKKKNNAGMTLIELLITTIILSVISTAIYASLNSGLKIWKRINQPLAHEDLDIFFDRFGRDLRNCARFTGLTFTGTQERVEFPAILPSPRFGGDVIGRVSYAYDPQAKPLPASSRTSARSIQEKNRPKHSRFLIWGWSNFVIMCMTKKPRNIPGGKIFWKAIFR